MRLAAGKALIPLKLLKADSEEDAVKLHEENKELAHAAAPQCDVSALAAKTQTINGYIAKLGDAGGPSGGEASTSFPRATAGASEASLQRELALESLLEGPAPLPESMVFAMLPQPKPAAPTQKAAAKGVKACTVRIAAALETYRLELAFVARAVAWESQASRMRRSRDRKSVV